MNVYGELIFSTHFRWKEIYYLLFCPHWVNKLNIHKEKWVKETHSFSSLWSIWNEMGPGGGKHIGCTTVTLFIISPASG